VLSLYPNSSGDAFGQISSVDTRIAGNWGFRYVDDTSLFRGVF
jgi:hypothetical protein